MILGILCGLSEAFDDGRRSREIGVSDAEIDDIDALGNRLLLHVIDGGEQIGRQGLDTGGNFDRETSHDGAALLSTGSPRQTNEAPRLLQAGASNQSWDVSRWPTTNRIYKCA